MDHIIFGDNEVPLQATPRDQRLHENAMRYAELSSQLEETKELLSYYKEILKSEFPEEPGEYVVDLDETRQLVLKVPEKWEWDKTTLSTLYPHNATPECVSTSYTVSRAKYEAAPEDVKNVLKQALTIKCGIPTIKVTG